MVHRKYLKQSLLVDSFYSNLFSRAFVANAFPAK